MVSVPLTPVIAQVGADRIAELVPDVEVLSVPMMGPVPDDARAEILFGIPIWSPTIETLLGRGVKWFHLAGTGVDSLPEDVLRSFVVTSARGVAAVPIAEFSMAAILSAAKKLPESWLDGPSPTPGYAELGEVNGQTLGIVGLGGIGTELASRARAMGMRVLAVRRTSQPGPPGVVVRSSLEDMLPECDHVVLAAPATKHTRRMMNAESFKRCKPGMHLVNIARGTLVDHEALLDALESGTISRATLDVTDPEPLPAGHPLYAHPGARVSAHISWSSPLAVERMTDQFIENLRRYLRGEPLAGVVDPDEGY